MIVAGTVIKGFGGETLKVVRNHGNDAYTMERLSIDRTHYGPEWCRNHGMAVELIVEADNGEKFEIWKKGAEMACAIPVREGKNDE